MFLSVSQVEARFRANKKIVSNERYIWLFSCPTIWNDVADYSQVSLEIFWPMASDLLGSLRQRTRARVLARATNQLHIVRPPQ